MKILKNILLFAFAMTLCFTPNHTSHADANVAEIITTDIIDVDNDVEMRYGGRMVWLAEWQPSTTLNADYGLGKFFYRVARSQYPIDKLGNYRFEVYFLSDSYYPAYYYGDSNGDGIANIYRSSTKIENVDLFVNGKPWINSLTSSTSFWLLFMGDYDNGIGDLGISFLYPQEYPKIYMTWSAPKPF